MNINEILDQMSSDITVLNFGEKMFGGLIVTVLSMSIVFIVLIILIGVIKLLDILVNGKTKVTDDENIDMIEIQEESEQDSLELIAVITAAISCSIGVSESKIRVVNINRVNDISPSWAKNGRIEQIQSRL